MKDMSADISCPICQNKVRIKIREMYPGNTKSCPACGAIISFEDDDGRKAQRALDDLVRTIRKIGK